MTNGEKLDLVFPDGIAPFSRNWLDAEYKAPTPKESLVVGDAISREDACRYIAEFVNHEYSTKEEEELIDNIITGIEHLPSVEPKAQEPILDNIRAEIKSLERFEIRGEVTPLVNVDKVLELLDKAEKEKKNG